MTILQAMRKILSALNTEDEITLEECEDIISDPSIAIKTIVELEATGKIIFDRSSLSVRKYKDQEV